jgi:hypothetical protein
MAKRQRRLLHGGKLTEPTRERAKIFLRGRCLTPERRKIPACLHQNGTDVWEKAGGVMKLLTRSDVNCSNARAKRVGLCGQSLW